MNDFYLKKKISNVFLLKLLISFSCLTACKYNELQICDDVKLCGHWLSFNFYSISILIFTQYLLKHILN